MKKSGEKKRHDCISNRKIFAGSKSFGKLKIIHIPGKCISLEDMLSCSFTKTELQINQQNTKIFHLNLALLYYKTKLETCTLFN